MARRALPPRLHRLQKGERKIRGSQEESQYGFCTNVPRIGWKCLRFVV